MSRQIKQYGPGSSWRTNNRYQEFGYSPNQPSNDTRHVLQHFRVANDASQTVSHNGAYSTGDLWVSEVIDENGNSTLDFVDKLGQTVAKKAQAGSSSYATTYYLYDDIGQLTFVIQPEGVEQMGTTYSNLNSSTFRNKWMFRYRYDGRRRMIEKQVPGSEPVYMVYDHLDRLVLTQDGNQRVQSISSGSVTISNATGKSYKVTGTGSLTLSPGVHILPNSTNPFEASSTRVNRYTFTKYDAQNRPIMTGICSISDAIDAIRDDAMALGAGETIASSGHGYTTSNTYPNTNSSSISIDQVLTVTYYDDYRFKGASYFGGNTQNYVDHGTDYTDNYQVYVKGLVTGSKTKILGTDTYLYSTTYYDDRYRNIQSITTNIQGGSDQVSTAYNFNGSPKKMLRNHVGEEAVDVSEVYSYDHMDRLLSTTHQIGTQSVVTLQSNSYNQIGELKEKNLGGSVQSIDYQYNIRGWLTKINGGQTYDDVSDKFGLELKYQDAATGYEQYNGNIGQALWRSNGSNQNYKYAYDELNRLESATYNNGNFNVSGITYDMNGNILTLQRKLSGTTVDNLDYDYSGNQLTTVGDSGSNSLFDEAASEGKVANEYLYDQNGNMIKDANKAIRAISYNHLNLPEYVATPDGTLHYTYDAGGMKLRKINGIGKVYDYVGGIHYEKETTESAPQLEFLQHSEGRARKSGSSFAYEYNLTDHLGNVRVTVNSSGTVIQRDDYYPFGLTFNSYLSGDNNNYLFNGVEKDQATGNYETMFRGYDPALGRFMQIDPLADFLPGINPYQFAFNNPILMGDPYGLAPKWFVKLKAHLNRFKYFLQGSNQAGSAYDPKHGTIKTKSGKRKGADHPIDFNKPDKQTGEKPKPFVIEAPKEDEPQFHMELSEVPELIDIVVREQPKKKSTPIVEKNYVTGQRIAVNGVFVGVDFKDPNQAIKDLYRTAKSLLEDKNLKVIIQVGTNFTFMQMPKKDTKWEETDLNYYDLMNSRAEAVMEVLINEFHVPKNQIRINEYPAYGEGNTKFMLDFE